MEICREVEMGRESEGEEGELYWQAGGQRGRQAERQTGRQADRQTGRHAAHVHVSWCWPLQHVRISDHGRPKDMPESIYKHMAEMTVLVTQLVVEFAKRLPRFTLIPQSDQIVLLKVRGQRQVKMQTQKKLLRKKLFK